MSVETAELARKGRRVAGMFVFMIGAGVVLESGAFWAGLFVMLAGLGVYVSGFMAKGTDGVLAGRAREEP